MGYTHYWYRPQVLDPQKFRAAVADCKKVCDALPIPLGNGLGEGEPEFSERRIWFNGHVNSGQFCRSGAGLAWPTDDAHGVAGAGDPDPETGSWFAGGMVNSRCVGADGDGSYETFGVLQEMADDEYAIKSERGWFACCKTNYRPYDLDVQCCLIVFAEHFGDQFKVSSDGDDEQWNEARSVCQHVLGYGLMFEMK